MNRNSSRPTTHRGIATLWTILTLGLLVLLMCYVVEAGRLYLARQQLVISLESAAMATAKSWCRDGAAADTLDARNTGIRFANANPVVGQTVNLTPNYAAGNSPSQNASCDGDLLLGSIAKRTPEVVFDTGVRAGCGKKSGPNAVAPRRISTGGWQTVTMCGRNYNEMVVVGTPNYNLPTSPAVVRIRNAGGNSFEFFVQNVNTGAPIPNIPVHFIVVEAGVYSAAANGITMEAHTYNSTVTDRSGSWNAQVQAYSNAYALPVVVGQVMTYNDPDWSVFWSRGRARNQPAGGQLRTGKHVGEDPDRTRANETVGYIILEAGSGHINGLPVYANRTPKSVAAVGNSTGYFAPTPADAPCSSAVASQTGEAGGNGSFVHLNGTDPVTASGVDLILDEDQLRDSERNHVTEYVNFAVFGGPCAVRARGEVEVPWLCRSFLGCELPTTRLTAEVTVYFDCEDDCAKTICVDQLVCP